MPTRAEYLRNEADRAERQARKAGSATAMFVGLDLAADMRRMAAEAEAEEAGSAAKADAKPE